jgi:probable HAF family extracellular repeat protein
LKNIMKFAAAAVLIAAAGWGQAAEYKFTALPYPAGTSMMAKDHNNRGQAIGYGYANSDGIDQAVVWNRGVPTLLPGLWAGSSSVGFAINRHGQAVGYSFDGYYGQQAVQWDGGIPTALEPPLGTGASTAVAINARGMVAGNAAPFYGGPSQAVKWVRGKPVLLGNLGGSASMASGINRYGDVVGYIVGPNGSGKRKPVIWHGNVATILETFLETECCNQASAINDLGQIVGWSSTPGGRYVTAVVWNGIKPTALQSLSDADDALALNNHGQAVGLLNAGGVTRAALWNLATGEGVDLNSYLTEAQRSAGWRLDSAQGINDGGVIVGIAFNGKTLSHSAFQLTPVSDP